jgi:hypothetical protein
MLWRAETLPSLYATDRGRALRSDVRVSRERRWAFCSCTSVDQAAAASADRAERSLERAWAAKRAKSFGVAGSGSWAVLWVKGRGAEMLDMERLSVCLWGDLKLSVRVDGLGCEL